MATNTMFGAPVRAVYDGSGNVVGLSAGGIALGVSITLYKNFTRITSVANTNEQILEQYLIPAGTLQIGDIIRIKARLDKSSTVDTASRRFRLGTSGTTADTVISVAGQTTSRTFADLREFVIVDATTIRRLTTEGATGFNVLGAIAADVTISDISNPLYISLTTTMTTGAETMSLEAFIVELIRG